MGLFSWRNWLWLLAGSPSISGAVIRTCWLQFYIQFMSLLAAYTSLLAAAVLCLTPYALSSFLRCCSVGSANPLYWVLLTPKACPVFWALAAPYIQWLFAIHAVIACLYFACQDSMSSFVLACWDSMSGPPGMWLPIPDWCLPKSFCCKLGHDWLLFIICITMGC